MYSTLKKEFEKQSKDYRPLILIVDNDRDNLLFASCVIESLGMYFITTKDAEECFSLVSKLLPDIILLDIVMPKLNGLEIANLIKQNRNFSQIPIIAVTGLTSTEDKTRLNAAGFDDYLCKPYMIEELEFKIYNHLKCNLI
ncbi:PleD family two-component system response regulator [Pleurocapsa sp. PCC 7319]|uniref:response regulator n=1 Tax=Pleurocapsa sp. PCC 7319 TaxID=118161 RepID=UPI00034AC58E|nr:response regulator [Pleurocapsa sp. PCC 7319]